MSKEKLGHKSEPTPLGVSKPSSVSVDLTKGKKRKRESPPEVTKREPEDARAENGGKRRGTGRLTVLDKPVKAENIPVGDQEKSSSELVSHRKSKSRPKESISTLQTPSQTPKYTKQNQANPSTHLTERREALLPIRKSLPIWPHAATIRTALKRNNVLVLTGETGSGKSTQVPQFLLSEPWCTKTIAITQPRRVAAISLARRVAEEMGSLMGNQSPAAKVGYSVRFDNATGPGTRVKFLTEGMLLQEMLRDPEMSQYSAVVVDEVHERSVNVDLILGFLRNLVFGVEKTKKRKSPLKVVVMSATADVEALVSFFGDEFNTPIEDGKTNAGNSEAKKATQELESQVSTCFVEGRQYPVKTVYLSEPTQDWVESALKIIFQIHYREPLPGDILVFLTGQDTIEGLEKLINEYAQGMDSDVPKLLALPLFAALPQHLQQLIFMPTPYRTRKVILATNIAETSVTVPGVRYVIDCGKSKIKQFRNRLGLESLLVKPISKSAAIQRKGRAGREAAGQCYRLYTEKGYESMDERTIPEILRCDLSHAILTMKARGTDDVLNFPFLDRPPREALEKALLQLLHLSALEETGTISEMGLKIAKLPLTPTLGRVLVEAAARDCLLDVIDIISALSVENIFLNLVTEERKEEAEAARRELYRREGDHMTLLVTVQRYAEERSDRKVWCEKHFVSHRAMQNVVVSRGVLIHI
jgi:ATP-dependent RNA helicase DHR2